VSIAGCGMNPTGKQSPLALKSIILTANIPSGNHPSDLPTTRIDAHEIMAL